MIYGDIWASMGEEDKMAERAELLSPYRWQGLDGSWNEAPHVRARYAE